MVALAARCARLRRVGFGCAYRHARDDDIQRASLGSAALGPDASAMAKDDLLADVEAQAHTRGIARRAIWRAVEETEDRLELLRRDPDPLVGDGEPHPAVVRTDVDRYRAASRSLRRPTLRRATCRNPDIAVIGVLSSWDAIERNCDFIRSSSFSCS